MAMVAQDHDQQPAMTFGTRKSNEIQSKIGKKLKLNRALFFPTKSGDSQPKSKLQWIRKREERVDQSISTTNLAFGGAQAMVVVETIKWK